MAPGIGWASLGRALIGIGVGRMYVPAIKAFAFKPIKRYKHYNSHLTTQLPSH